MCRTCENAAARCQTVVKYDGPLADRQRTTNGATVVFYDTACDEYFMRMNPANAGKPHMTVVKYDNPPVKEQGATHMIAPGVALMPARPAFFTCAVCLFSAPARILLAQTKRTGRLVFVRLRRDATASGRGVCGSPAHQHARSVYYQTRQV